MTSRSVRSALRNASAVGDRRDIVAPGAIPLDSELDRIEELLLAERLGQGIRWPRISWHRPTWGYRMASEENDRQMNVRFGQLALEFKPAQTRHLTSRPTSVSSVPFRGDLLR